MLCKLFITIKLAFPLPPLIMLLARLYLIPFFCKFFRVGNNHFETGLFLWLAVVRLTTDGGWTFVMEIDVHPKVSLTQSFVSNSGYNFISIDETS